MLRGKYWRYRDGAVVDVSWLVGVEVLCYPIDMNKVAVNEGCGWIWLARMCGCGDYSPRGPTRVGLGAIGAEGVVGSNPKLVNPRGRQLSH